jgi:hypothetical protein
MLTDSSIAAENGIIKAVRRTELFTLPNGSAIADILALHIMFRTNLSSLLAVNHHIIPIFLIITA